MGLHFRVYEHLLPRTSLWSLKLEGALRWLFQGLEGLPTAAQAYLDSALADAWADSTTELAMWEDQFGLVESGLTEDERRDRLAGAWAAVGGQSPRYLQDTMQAAGFDVWVHEWWQQPVIDPLVPVPRDPRLYLSEGGPMLTTSAGEALMQAGEPDALAGQSFEPLGYPLVNKVATTVTLFLGAGDPELQAGDALAYAGQDLSTVAGSVQYPLPDDPALWPFFNYWGAETFPERAVIPAARRDEFENLLLKLNPGQQWLGVLAEYS